MVEWQRTGAAAAVASNNNHLHDCLTCGLSLLLLYIAVLRALTTQSTESVKSRVICAFFCHFCSGPKLCHLSTDFQNSFSYWNVWSSTFKISFSRGSFNGFGISKLMNFASFGIMKSLRWGPFRYTAFSPYFLLEYIGEIVMYRSRIATFDGIYRAVVLTTHVLL